MSRERATPTERMAQHRASNIYRKTLSANLCASAPERVWSKAMNRPVSRRTFVAGAAASLTLGAHSAAAFRQAQLAPRKRALIVGVQGYYRNGDDDSAQDLNTLEDV